MIREEEWLLKEKYRGTVTEAFESDKKRLAFGEPLSYVIGSEPFLGLTIYLDSHPLIPRVETEWWTEKLITTVPKDRPLCVLDLCAGSGAVGCALLSRLPKAQVYFGEVNPEHKKTILKNIRENHLDESRAHIGIGDLFEPFAQMKFDVIAANPPYVPKDRVLPASVALYEPSLAFHAGDDGLDVIRRIAKALREHLVKNGVAWIECDWGHAEATRELFVEEGMVGAVHPDQYDKPRIVVVSFS